MFELIIAGAGLLLYVWLMRVIVLIGRLAKARNAAERAHDEAEGYL